MLWIVLYEDISRLEYKASSHRLHILLAKKHFRVSVENEVHCKFHARCYARNALERTINANAILNETPTSEVQLMQSWQYFRGIKWT